MTISGEGITLDLCGDGMVLCLDGGAHMNLYL